MTGQIIAAAGVYAIAPTPFESRLRRRFPLESTSHDEFLCRDACLADEPRRVVRPQLEAEESLEWFTACS